MKHKNSLAVPVGANKVRIIPLMEVIGKEQGTLGCDCSYHMRVVC